MDEPTPEGQVLPMTPPSEARRPRDTGHLLAVPSAPTPHTGEVVGGGRELEWGAEDTTGWKEPRQSWPISSPLAPSCSQQGRGAGRPGREQGVAGAGLWG